MLSGISMVKSPVITVGSTTEVESIHMPAPRIVTALVMSVAMKFPEDRVMTSPWTAAVWAWLKAVAP